MAFEAKSTKAICLPLGMLGRPCRRAFSRGRSSETLLSAAEVVEPNFWRSASSDWRKPSCLVSSSLGSRLSGL